VPDLPGCMSDGETAEAALASVKDAVAAWIDEGGRPSGAAAVAPSSSRRVIDPAQPATFAKRE
jgi:antitoxin HicB